MIIKSNKLITGISLLEMIFSISIITVLLLLSIAPVQKFYQSIQAEQIAYRLKNSLNSARMYALKSQKNIVVCPLINNKCTNNWHLGWSSFIDYNDNKTLNTTDRLLYTEKLPKSAIAIKFKKRIYRYIKFSTNGTVNYTSFYICSYASSSDKYANYRVIINRTGRTRIETNSGNYC